MSKLLIALLALDIGVSLSKVFIFTWKSNFLEKKEAIFLDKQIHLMMKLLFFYYS